MKRNSISPIVIALLLAVLPCSQAWADGGIKGWLKSLFGGEEEVTDVQGHEDLAALTVDENLKLVEVPAKKHNAVVEAQKSVCKRLKEFKDYKVELMRDEEVVRVTIPAAKLFAPNDTTLNDRADELLRPLLQCMRTPDYYHILLVMHSDNTGNDSYCFLLTTQRVLAVFDWYDRNGAQTDYVVPYAAGSTEPLKPNNSTQNRYANRRLEIYLVPGELMIK